MTGADFEAARLRLGLTYEQLAEALGWSASSARTLRRYARKGPPSGVAARIQQMLEQGRGGDGEPA